MQRFILNIQNTNEKIYKKIVQQKIILINIVPLNTSRYKIKPHNAKRV